MRTFAWLAAFCLIPTAVVSRPEQAVDARPRKTTVLGTQFEVDPRFEAAIAEQIAKVRKELRSRRESGKLIAYVSTPISARGGGHERTNLAIAAFVKERLEVKYGAGLWALDPGQFQLPSVAGQAPQGGEYLYMWTEILAGADGKGGDFDLVYFTGPTDVAGFFGSTRLEAIDRYIDRQAATDEPFRKEVANDAGRRQAFRRFYAFRASVAWSKGAHDEWNIFVRINRKRALGDLGLGDRGLGDRGDLGEQIAMQFDGRALSPAEMETEITPGYEVTRK